MIKFALAAAMLAVAMLVGVAVAEEKEPPVLPPSPEVQLSGTEVFGIGGGTVPRVVYVLDRFGETEDAFGPLREEMKKPAASWGPRTQVAVVLFSEKVDQTFPAKADKFVALGDTGKRDFEAFIDRARAAGQNSDPRKPAKEAMEKAFALKPTSIVLMTRRNLDPKVAEDVAALNKAAGGKVWVSVVAFGEMSKDGKATLTAIASENKGRIKFVAEKDRTGNSDATKEGAATRDGATQESPKVGLFGVETVSGKVAFVLDRSGSMIDTFNYVQQEVRVRVAAMKPEQRFAVIFFAEKVEETFPAGAKELVPASDAEKRKAQTFVSNVRAAGRNDDLYDPFAKALQRAFATGADTIFFLTDGNFDPRVVEEAKRLSKAAGGKVKINTIAFVRITAEGEAALKSIAKDSGGAFRFVEEKELPEKK